MLSLLLSASLIFSHVEYDVPGADDGREWISITNTGPAVDLTGWKLYEGGVNHKIVPVSSPLLPGGATAVIVQSPEGYLADHPDYSGLMYKASFSLSNSGESLALKDASSTVVASTTYTAAPVVKQKTVSKPRNPIPTPAVHTASATQPARVVEATPAPGSTGLGYWVAGLVLLIGGGIMVAFITWPKPGDASGYTITDDHS